MAAQLTFDNCSIGGTAIANSVFVRGGNLSLDPNMAEVATADGVLYQIPSYVGGSASCRLKGDYLALNTPVGLGVAIILYSGVAAVYTGTGLVTASYSESDDTTSLELKLDPTEDAE